MYESKRGFPLNGLVDIASLEAAAGRWVMCDHGSRDGMGYFLDEEE